MINGVKPWTSLYVHGQTINYSERKFVVMIEVTDLLDRSSGLLRIKIGFFTARKF